MNRQVIFPLPDKNQFEKFRSVVLWNKWNILFENKVIKAIKIGFNEYFYYHKILIYKMLYALPFATKVFYKACKHANLEIIYLLIEFGYNNWNNGLQGAEKGSHKNIIDMLEKEKKKYNNPKLFYNYTKSKHDYLTDIAQQIQSNNWSGVFSYACRSGNLWAVQMAIEKLNSSLSILPIAIQDVKKIERLRYGLALAVNNNQIEIAEMMIEKLKCFAMPFKLPVNMQDERGIEDPEITDLEIQVKYSCYYGHIEIVELLIKNGANIEIVKTLLKEKSFENLTPLLEYLNANLSNT